MLEIGAHEEHEPRNEREREREKERKEKKNDRGWSSKGTPPGRPQTTRRIFYDFTIFLRLDRSFPYFELTRDRKT